MKYRLHYTMIHNEGAEDQQVVAQELIFVDNRYHDFLNVLQDQLNHDKSLSAVHYSLFKGKPKGEAIRWEIVAQNRIMRESSPTAVVVDRSPYYWEGFWERSIRLSTSPSYQIEGLILDLTEEIYQWQMERGLSHQEMADKMGLSKMGLTYFYRGVKGTDLNKLVAASAALGCKWRVVLIEVPKKQYHYEHLAVEHKEEELVANGPE